MQLKIRKLLNFAKRISAASATIRYLSQNGKRRGQAGAGWQTPVDGGLVDEQPPLLIPAFVSIPTAPVQIIPETVVSSNDTFYEFSDPLDPRANSRLSCSSTTSDSQSYCTDDAKSAGTTLLDDCSFLTASEGAFVKRLERDMDLPHEEDAPKVKPAASSFEDTEEAADRPSEQQYTGDPLGLHSYEGAGDLLSESEGLHSEEREVPPSSMLSTVYETKDDLLLARSPPPVLVEPEVPDPFIVDDGEDTSDDERSEDEEPPKSVTPSVAAEDEIALAQSTVLEQDPSTPTQQSQAPQSFSPYPSNALFSPQPNVNKDVPSVPEPASSEEEDEDEPPELYLPGLVIPTMFLPIPNTDPLTTLLTKYIPPERRPQRDLSGEWQRNDFHTLVMTNSWRALARMARDRIVGTSPEELPLILSLWYLRLASLARLRLFNQTSAECTNLFTVLNAVEPPSARAWLFEKALPFELEVLHAKTQYWAGDHMGYLDALSALLTQCKKQARASGRKKDPAGTAMWRERGARICLILASQLIEMKDYMAAAKLLEPLCLQEDNISSPYLRSAVARIYLQGGHIAMATKHLAAVAQDPTSDPSLKAMNAALLATAEGDWERAENALRQIIENDPENYVAVNNLAVALLSRGHLKEGIQILEDALKTSPSTIVVAEPFLFNLSTLYELRSSTAADKKRELLIEVAKWAGDGLRTACLKMPTT